MNRRNVFFLTAITALGLLNIATWFKKRKEIDPDLLTVKTMEGMGRGVFAAAFIKSGTTVLKDHTLRLSKTDRQQLARTILADYYFEDDDDTAHLALGMASLLNHSFKAPNVEQEWEAAKEGQVLSFSAIKDILAGEQLFFDYDFDAGEIPAWADNLK